jgi:hypothetical protein
MDVAIRKPKWIQELLTVPWMPVAARSKDWQADSEIHRSVEPIPGSIL